jgi:hypothetical protein
MSEEKEKTETPKNYTPKTVEPDKKIVRMFINSEETKR